MTVDSQPEVSLEEAVPQALRQQRWHRIAHHALRPQNSKAAYHILQHCLAQKPGAWRFQHGFNLRETVGQPEIERDAYACIQEVTGFRPAGARGLKLQQPTMRYSSVKRLLCWKPRVCTLEPGLPLLQDFPSCPDSNAKSSGK